MNALLDLSLPNLKATRKLADTLAPLLHPGDVVTLEGCIGTGKTTFIRALLETLGCIEEVPSPTFNLLHTYELGSVTFWHFDLFRIERLSDVYELGVEDALENGICLIEWPKIMATILPTKRLELEFFYQEDCSRKVLLRCDGAWKQRLHKVGIHLNE
ncbi:MAG: tRNA (adenosine(37)-N6)-threonylcarbamoyltransferase complex ATPase subunit type 1 TsaE [Rhodospirillaceae bacterium]|nr:tRNA (adenosine(37)-N6)-threonylcarbamoyltransferase complex ATPase subunit type 1 TsaE [Rhodospirillaceae bacterium]|tara:strand:- start:2939 stop:3412 length:474 start_codon:yes stop_codon:yes gene_type:complete